jgi:hypothetical protein
MRPNTKVVSFPNQSRSFDGAKNRVRFWGYDSAIEISFFVETDALRKLGPNMRDAEGDVLRTFDAARDRIEEVANKVYMHSNKIAYTYTLAADDF